MLDTHNAGRTIPASNKQPAKPRICMPTTRGFSRRAYQCSLYEAQDVLLDIDDVDLICMEPEWGLPFRQKLQRRLLYRDVSRKLASWNPGIRRVQLSQEYDLFVAVCQNYWDLLYINAIDGWKEQCKTSVCWLDELWVADIPLSKYWLHILERFDYIFVGMSGTAGPLSKALGRSCRWLPGAVDCLRFSPYPAAPNRAVDVYSIGRRWGGIHRALLQASSRGEMFYLYDTFPSMANLEPYDHRQHRDLIANITKRSRYFLVAPGKMNSPEETQGQVTIGYRYFEGAAAGAVMIGQVPDCDAFSEAFPWPDVVIPIQSDGSDTLEVLAGLDADPERLSAISRRNAAEALQRHDWVHRWSEIFRSAGVEPSAGLAARESRLKQLAGLAAQLA